MNTERITRSDIDRVKQEHILRNLLYTPIEAASILAISVRSIFKLVESGDLTPAGKGASQGVNTRGTRITAESLEVYRKGILAR